MWWVESEETEMDVVGGERGHRDECGGWRVRRQR